MYGGVCDGDVGVHEGTKKVLVITDYSRAAHARDGDRLDAGIGSRPIGVHIILTFGFRSIRDLSRVPHNMGLEVGSHIADHVG